MTQQLYVARPVSNFIGYASFCKSLGFDEVVADPHITLAYSEKEVNMKNIKPEKSIIELTKKNILDVTVLGDNDVIVLLVEHPELFSRWKKLCSYGCSWDYPTYKSHITICLNKDNKISEKKLKEIKNNLKTFLNSDIDIKLILGAEEHSKLDDDAFDNIKYAKLDNILNNISTVLNNIVVKNFSKESKKENK